MRSHGSFEPDRCGRREVTSHGWSPTSVWRWGEPAFSEAVSRSRAFRVQLSRQPVSRLPRADYFLIPRLVWARRRSPRQRGGPKHEQRSAYLVLERGPLSPSGSPRRGPPPRSTSGGNLRWRSRPGGPHQSRICRSHRPVWVGLCPGVASCPQQLSPKCSGVAPHQIILAGA